jgi:hypothetical protein
MATPENQPSSRVRRAPGAGPADGPAGEAARPGGPADDAGAGRGGIRVSRLLSCSLIWHAPVARSGLRLDRPHRAGSGRRPVNPRPPDMN